MQSDRAGQLSLPSAFPHACACARSGKRGLVLAAANPIATQPDCAFLRLTFLAPAGFFLRQISDLGPMLTGLMTYHILPQPLSPDQVKQEGEPPAVLCSFCLLGCLWCSRLLLTN